LGSDQVSTKGYVTVTTTEQVQLIGDTLLMKLIEEWKDHNNTAYNQILLCISPEQQTAIDITDNAANSWKILMDKFKLKDPSKISIVRTRYENYHMAEGQSVMLYLTVMKEFRSQLMNMGEAIPDSTQAATILRNILESWRVITQTIRMIHTNVNMIEDKLEAHEVDLNALKFSSQAATVFAACSNPLIRQFNAARTPASNTHTPIQNSSSRSPFVCSNCGRSRHSIVRCYARGGGLARRAPWNNQQECGTGQSKNTCTFIPPLPSSNSMSNSMPNLSNNSDMLRPTKSVKLTSQNQDDIAWMAHISEVHTSEIEETNSSKVIISANTSAFSSFENDPHIWFIDSAASSHLCGDKSLFSSIYTVPSLTIKIVSGNTFVANQRGTIRITLRSDLSHGLEDVPIILNEVIYVPMLNANLLSIGRMTNANVLVTFGKDHSTLSLDDDILA
jgi:gag-polypeptide of LTR copia-type/Pol polyprotein, beta-barrel domain